MTADYVIGELSHIQHTLRQLKDPDILSVEVNSDGDARIHLYAHTMEDAEEMIGDMGNGLYHKNDQGRDYDWYSVTGGNGVEVYWLIRKKAAPDAGTSEAANEESNCEGLSRVPIIGDEGPEVKEDSNETSV